MKKSKLLLLILLATFTVTNIYSLGKERDLSLYNMVWNSPSKDVTESMPVGGGDIGLNVWVENGDVLFYIGQSGTFDENNQMLKHGRVRLSLTPNPFNDYSSFSQTLNLKKGDLEIKSVNISNDVTLNIWVDVFRPVIHVSMSGKKPFEVEANYESWRTEDYTLTRFDRHACFSYSEYLGEVVKFKDEITAQNGAIKWMHRNREDRLVRDFCIAQQGLTGVKDRIYDSQTGRTFGGVIFGDNLENSGKSVGKYVETEFTAFKLSSIKPQKEQEIMIALETGQFDSAEKWNTSLQNTITEAKAESQAKAKNEKWWSDFWGKSYIFTGDNRIVNRDEDSYKVWQLGKNFQLFRYMQACNAYGKFPSKFNGSIFTVDPKGTKPNQKDIDFLDPDYRSWGGGSFTAQNQRLVYWPMLKNGDFEMMKPQFDFYKNGLSSAIARSEVYWNHSGASFTEQIENFGLPVAATWGFKEGVRTREADTERGELTNKFVRHHYVNQLEFSYMILQYYQFSGESIAEYLPFIKSSIEFFDKHYRYEAKKLTGKELGEDGKLVFYPSTAAEMYKVAKNPTDVIAALQRVVSEMLILPKDYVNDSEIAYYRNLLHIIPDMPFDTKEGHIVIKPADNWAYVANSEIPELYTLFPYSTFGIGKAGLDIAKNTWNYGESNKKRSFLKSWSQVGIFAARLGLTEDASELIIGKLGDSERRFPAFWGPGVDWLPDFNHGGTAMLGIQEMLMQTLDSEKIYILPAWPKDWDVSFKLHAPKQTTVEVELKDGKIEKLIVTPESRRRDVVVCID